jgi:hypothetical protein
LSNKQKRLGQNRKQIEICRINICVWVCITERGRGREMKNTMKKRKNEKEKNGS